jgi:hypothetical protein
MLKPRILYFQLLKLRSKNDHLAFDAYILPSCCFARLLLRVLQFCSSVLHLLHKVIDLSLSVRSVPLRSYRSPLLRLNKFGVSFLLLAELVLVVNRRPEEASPLCCRLLRYLIQSRLEAGLLLSEYGKLDVELADGGLELGLKTVSIDFLIHFI